MKIALFGATGRLGRAIASQILRQNNCQLTEVIAHPNSSSLGRPLDPSTVQPLVSASFQNLANLLIDVSIAHHSFDSLTAALENKMPLVIGTTALHSQQIEELHRASQRIPIFFSTNFSLGQALFQKLCRIAAKELPNTFSTDLFDLHHKHKKDTPSGTALQIKKLLQPYKKDLSIHSIRSGSIPGEHRLLFHSDDEKIELSHSVHDRAVFAKGALLAAHFLLKQKPGLYGMDDLLV